MRESYPIMQDWIGLSEGGYVNHPKDPGGATDRGITQRTYSGWRRSKGLAPKSVRGIPKHVAEEIIEKEYFDRSGADRLPVGLDYTVGDYAVNSGVSQAVRDLQRSVGVQADGVYGPVTHAAVLDHGNVQALIVAVNERRWRFMQSLKHFPSFRNGWERRVWGDEDGVQENDIGVADRSVRMTRQNAHKVPAPKRDDVTIQARPMPGEKLTLFEKILGIIRMIIGDRNVQR